MLWYLHLCSVNDITVISYIDHSNGKMEEDKRGNGKFIEITLSPQIIITDKNSINRHYNN